MTAITRRALDVPISHGRYRVHLNESTSYAISYAPFELRLHVSKAHQGRIDNRNLTPGRVAPADNDSITRQSSAVQAAKAAFKPDTYLQQRNQRVLQYGLVNALQRQLRPLDRSTQTAHKSQTKI